MAMRHVTCWVAVCDLCGNTTDSEGATPHFDSVDEAIYYATVSDGTDGWTRTPDGLLVCDNVRDTAHEDTHAVAGKRMGRDAMTVRWPHSSRV
jgi:hypothetical protein